mmetsp:Transcript_34786/g.63318  ORF Transcript_34786/g.63318 Transcript_34786/m.63318 type:complete len:82 (-) Transcript_34786:614-859(-)
MPQPAQQISLASEQGMATVNFPVLRWPSDGQAVEVTQTTAAQFFNRRALLQPSNFPGTLQRERLMEEDNCGENDTEDDWDA